MKQKYRGGRKTDGRMKKAMELRLEDPDLKSKHSLLVAGYNCEHAQQSKHKKQLSR